MNRAALARLALALAVVGACSRPSEGTGGVTSPTTNASTAALPSLVPSSVTTAAPTATPAASASAPVVLSAPTFHPVTCPAPPPSVPAPPGIRGCEHCPPGEYCQQYYDHGGGFGACRKNACRSDADCKGALCNCLLPSSCYPGNCRSSADCGGRDCAPDRWRYGHGPGVYCRTDKDTCKSHSDCTSDQECAYLGDRWGCRPTTPAPPPG